MRGSSSRGAVGALLAAARELAGGAIVALTPDGPRGPRRELKPGVLAAAQRAGVPVIPVYAEVDRAWRLDSWDRFWCRSRSRGCGSRTALRSGSPGARSTWRRRWNRPRLAMDDVERMAQWPDGTATPTG